MGAEPLGYRDEESGLFLGVVDRRRSWPTRWTGDDAWGRATQRWRLRAPRAGSGRWAGPVGPELVVRRVQAHGETHLRWCAWARLPIPGTIPTGRERHVACAHAERARLHQPSDSREDRPLFPIGSPMPMKTTFVSLLRVLAGSRAASRRPHTTCAAISPAVRFVLQSHLTRRAERAAHGTPRLRRDAHGHAVRVAHEHGLDHVPGGTEAEQRLASSNHGRRCARRAPRSEWQLGGKTLPERGRDSVISSYVAARFHSWD